MPPSEHSEGPPRSKNGLAIVAVVLALVAVGLSAWAAFGPDRKSAGVTYGPTQQSEAKTAVCAAAELVRKGVTLNTNLQSPGGGGPGDVTGALAVAANARLSLSDGGSYLLARIDPATPTDVAGAVRKFANTLLDIGAAATAGMPNSDPEQAARLRAADTANTEITRLCK